MFNIANLDSALITFSKAIKKLETKLENLTALIDKSKSVQLCVSFTPNYQSIAYIYTRLSRKEVVKLNNLFILPLSLSLSLLCKISGLFTVVIATVYDASSCKEAYEIDRLVVSFF